MINGGQLRHWRLWARPRKDGGVRVSHEGGRQVGTAAIGFEAVFRQHVTYVGRSLRYLGVAEGELEDACQEVFVVVSRRLPEFEGRAALTTWLYRICLRVAMAHRRKERGRREDPVANPPEQADATSPEDELERVLARDRLRAVLASLDEGQRAAFVLYEIEGLPMKQVADLLECPLQTAYSRLHAARARVLGAVAPDEEGKP